MPVPFCDPIAMELTETDVRNLVSSGGHSFHIPVLGTGFTIDSPLRVAKYGISSAISLGDDVLIEQMRKFHSENEGEPYEPIPSHQEDVRAQRITAYLNLLDRLVRRQVDSLQSSPFETGSEIACYYEMLPDTPLKDAYHEMLTCVDRKEKARKQAELRQLAVPGSIDVNIMSKVDFDVYRDGKRLPDKFCTAMAALRGFAKSSLRSSVVFSAGLNPRLYGYVAQFDDFFPNSDGTLTKKIILKVSDYRSAVIQGKFLAKRGLWVSEYRIESGLNCGGHAFASKGLLLGPILDEFKQKKEELAEQLHAVYLKSLARNGRPAVEEPHEVQITVQGGICTAAENEFLLAYYNVNGTGWGTPFLLVPEATNVDDENLEKLLAATEGDIYLSDSSPFGVPFWNLRDSTSEEARCRRIVDDKPGAPCPKGYLRGNTEFTEVPICIASRAYQKRRLVHLSKEELTEDQLAVVTEQVLAKSCICHDLAGGATVKYGIDPNAEAAICPGPNIDSFSKISTLKEMIGHIYGRVSLLTNSDCPHMLIREIRIYTEYLRKEMERFAMGLLPSTPAAYFSEFKENLLRGIEYYRDLAEEFVAEERSQFLDELKTLREAIEHGMGAIAGCA